MTVVTFWQRMDRAGRGLAPFAITVMLVLVGLIPVHIPRFAPVSPALALAAVFHWSVYRPDLLRPLAVFAVGLLQDLLSGAPVGMNALTFLAVHGLVLTQRRVFLAGTFPLMWFGFGIVVFGVAAAQWLLYSLLTLSIARIDAAIAGSVMTLLIFPAAAAVFLLLHRAFLHD